MKALTQQQVDSFRYNGFLFPLSALTPEETAEALAGLNRLETHLGCKVADADVRWRSHNHAHSPWLANLARHKRILDVVEDMIGPDILIWTSTFFIKEAQSPTFAAWHQDGTYFGLEPHALVTAWVALTDASKEAGCMEIVPSRGAPRQRYHAPLRLEHSINRAGQTIMEDVNEDGMETMALRPGQFSLHHELAMHRSMPNNAAHRRIGVGLHYIPTSVRSTGPVRMSAMLVRGEDRYGNFELMQPPAVEMDAAGLEAHELAVSRYRANYNEQVKRHEAAYATAAE